MVSANLKQASFGGGIISPQTLGRTDQQKYAVGLRECVNAWVTRYGTIENRAGTVFVGAVKDSSRRVRLVPFVFSSSISYLLEFGLDYIRPYRNGARISVVGAAAWSNVTAYVQGDLVTYGGQVYRALLANTGFQPNLFPADWNLQVGGLLEIVTDIPQAALPVLQYVQQSDVMTITAQLFQPRQLLRFGDTVWQFVTFTPTSGIAPPLGVSVTAGFPATTINAPTGLLAVGGLAGGTTRYNVTAYAHSPGRESVIADFILVGFHPDPGTPVVLTWNVVAGAAGYAVYRSDNLPGDVCGIIAVTDALTYSDDLSTADINGAGPIKNRPSGSGGGKVFTYVVTSISDSTGEESLPSNPGSAVGSTPSTANPNVITWNTVAGASSYRIYRSNNGVYGFVGTSFTLSFNDDNIIPDTSIQPPTELPLFQTPQDYPAICGYYQQRLMFANTINQPQTVWMSRVGVYQSFSESTPVVDDDAIQFTIAGKQVQEVRALVDLGKLIIHTSNAEYICTGNQAGTMTPGAIGLTANGSAGAALLAPVIIGNTDLFIQQSATRILDLRYDVKTFSYGGKDLTKFATDLFAGRTITDMSWQKLPHSIVWCILDNGTMAALTYVGEDETWAWHEHTTFDATFENVAVIAEGTQDIVYVVARRLVNGSEERYIERLASRACLDTVMLTDSVFVDSSLTFDGRNQGSTTMTATTGAGWTTQDVITLTASVSTFVSGDLGNAVILQQVDASSGLVTAQTTFAIVGYVSSTVVMGVPQRDVPTWAQATPLTSWGKAVKTFSGIDHLEGQALSILADGSVEADPLDPGYPIITVIGGAFTLADPAMVVTAGLPLQMDLQSLPVENATGETIANRRITVRRCTPIFHNSRGGLFGQDFQHLDQWKQAPTEAESFGFPVPGITGPSSVPINGTPELTGQVCIRLTNPVPFGISAIVITGEIMDAA
jgi:hypothetical protein